MWVATHIVLDVWSAAMGEEDAAALVVAGLAAQVQRREPAAVLHVDIGLGRAEGGHGAAVALPGGLVQGGVPVLQRRH